MSTATLRRLDDRERYWGLTWPGWVAATIGCGVLYLAVRFSPLATKPTITIAVFALAFAGMVLYGISGQALSPGRQLSALIAYHRSPKQLQLPDHPDRRGLVLNTPAPTPKPDLLNGGGGVQADELSGLEHLSAHDPLTDDDVDDLDDTFEPEFARGLDVGEHVNGSADDWEGDGAGDDDGFDWEER